MQSKSFKNAEQCYNPIITYIVQYQYNSPARLQCNFIVLIRYIPTHADIHTDIHTDRHTYRQTYIQTDIHTDRHTYIQTDIHTDRHTSTYRQTYIQTDIHTDTHTYRQTYIQAWAAFWQEIKLETTHYKNTKTSQPQNNRTILDPWKTLSAFTTQQDINIQSDP